MDTNQTSDTGTRDVTYNLTAVLYHALQGVENCNIYMGDARGKEEHRQFFQHAMEAQKQLAEQAKTLLHDCLMSEVQGGGGQQQGQSTSAFGQQGMSAGTGAIAGEIASTQTHSFDEARDDGSAFRFASGQTEGGSDQFEGGSEQDRQGGSALTSGQQVGGTHNDPSSGQSGQSGLGQGQRHNEMTTGGGGTSSF
nr:hypothetical protein [uncultured Sphingomonas sp.]